MNEKIEHWFLWTGMETSSCGVVSIFAGENRLRKVIFHLVILYSITLWRVRGMSATDVSCELRFVIAVLILIRPLSRRSLAGTVTRLRAGRSGLD
jgi:hypothetical protein